jgi:predicted nucleotide-binding protein
MADKFRGKIEQLESAVAFSGIAGSWRAESDGSHRYDAVNEGILRWWPTTGSLSFQGPVPGRAELKTAVMTALADGEGSKRLVRRETSDKRIFIVHGHDIKVLERLELILRRLGLEPYMLIKDAGTGGTLIEELEGNIGKEGSAVFGIVIMTPDDIGYAVRDGADKARSRARQNVILEMGMMLASLTRKNVAILRHVSIEQPSDADGVKYIAFDKDIGECTQQLAQRLMNSGFEIDPKRLAAV